nr:MAG: replication associated protein [Arizlama virus]
MVKETREQEKVGKISKVPKVKAIRGAPRKNWCFTIQTNITSEQLKEGDSEHEPLGLWNDESMEYLVYQLEKAPTTGQLHFQGFVCLKKKSFMSALKKINTTAHWEATRGTPKQAADYCKKDDTRQAGPWEFGTQPDDRGKLSATAIAMAMIKNREPMEDIAEEVPQAIVRSSRGLMELKRLVWKSPDWRDVQVTWLWGPTGCGKTRTAFASKCADGRNPYIVTTNGQWWDGYDGQDTIIFDEFYGQIRCADMLRWLDGYPLQLPVKGSFASAFWTKVYITSNQSPDKTWTKESSWNEAAHSTIPLEVREAFFRRISNVVHMGESQ